MGLFAVDQWNCRSRLYFLTHMHADHTHGLSSRWCLGPIYCSGITAGLLLNKFQGLDHTLVHTLEVGVTALITIPHEQAEPQLLEVTPILANHCPGAVMYLFRGEFGCILHTGDFRWDSADETSLEGMQQLRAALHGGSVDLLYLDNTFCHPSFNFPPRQVALQQILQIIADHPSHDVIVGVDSLGKEELLLEIARTFDTKFLNVVAYSARCTYGKHRDVLTVWVWPERLQTMRLLQLPDVFTTDSTATRIRAVPRYSMSNENLRLLNSIFRPTIGILPTGWRPACWNVTGHSEQRRSCSDGHRMSTTFMPQQQASGGRSLSGSGESDFFRCDAIAVNHCVRSMGSGDSVEGIHMVQYSLHCPFLELESFIRSVKPRIIIGTVPSPGDLDTDPSRHFRGMLKEDRVGHVRNSEVTGFERSELAQVAKLCRWDGARGHNGPKTSRLSQKTSNLRQQIRCRLGIPRKLRKKRLGTLLLASLEGEAGEI